MADIARDYNLALLRRYVWPSLSPRQKRRVRRIDPLLFATLRGLACSATEETDLPPFDPPRSSRRLEE